jgi:hypothetical protein
MRDLLSHPTTPSILMSFVSHPQLALPEEGAEEKVEEESRGGRRYGDDMGGVEISSGGLWMSGNPNRPMRGGRMGMGARGGETALSMGAKVAHLFADATHTLRVFAKDRLADLLAGLFKCFEGDADPDLAHFRVIFTELLLIVPEATSELTLTVYLDTLLANAGKPPVLQCIVALLQANMPSVEAAAAHHDRLAEVDFVGRCAKILADPESPASAPLATLLASLIEESSFAEESMLAPLLASPDAALVATRRVLVPKVDFDSSPVLSLFRMLARAEDLTDTPSLDFAESFARVAHSPRQNQFLALHSQVVSTLMPLIEPLSAALVEACDTVPRDNSGRAMANGAKLKRPFTLHRLELVETLVAIVQLDSAVALPLLPADLWRVLATWFFEYRYNSLFHALFFSLFHAAAMQWHEPSLRVLLDDVQFLSRCINRYEDDEADTKGFIITIMNVLRLMVDAKGDSPDDWLCHFLAEHAGWQDALGRLRADTEQRVDRPYAVPSADESVFNMGSGSFGALMSSSMNNPIGGQQIPDPEGGIDLGSRYADDLGFVGVCAPEEHVPLGVGNDVAELVGEEHDDATLDTAKATVVPAKKQQQQQQKQQQKSPAKQPAKAKQQQVVKEKVEEEFVVPTVTPASSKKSGGGKASGGRPNNYKHKKGTQKGKKRKARRH